jgi:hypothetical protein
MTKITMKSRVAALKVQLANDASTVEKAMVQLALRQTEYELESKETINKNRQGFSSSNAHWGTIYAQLVAGGGKLEGEHLERAIKIATFHARQLARIAAEAEGGVVEEG